MIYSDYNVDITHIAENRKNGVSGMMRVKNDAEFLEASIDSCIDALDELIIVYNDCTDNSPELILKKQQQYPDKIKVYEYKPEIYAWNLTKQQVDDILQGKISPIHVLANYYNFALAKTSRKYVMKIDADQIYFSHKLRLICDAYRYNYGNLLLSIIFSIIPLIVISCVLVYLKINYLLFKSKKFHFSNWMWDLYFTNLIRVIKSVKPNIALHGINSVIQDGTLYVSLSKENTDGPNILPPLNGGGDHPIFRVTPKTYFIPYHDDTYNKLNQRDNSVIELLVGVNRLVYAGVSWIHLNAYRLSYRKNSLRNIEKYPNSFSVIENLNLNKIHSISPNSTFTLTSRFISEFIYFSIKSTLDTDIITIMQKYKL